MNVHIKQIQEGCILSEDIFLKTNRPIMTKKTVLTKLHIEFLEAFLIQKLNVESTLVDGSKFNPSNIELVEEENPDLFLKHYLETVFEYKKMFTGWSSNMPLQITEVRDLILPMVEKSFEKKESLIYLHHFSNKDDYIYHHSVSVAIIAAHLAKALHFEYGEVIQISLAAFLSDCGMSKIKGKTLFNNESLSVEEYDEIKKHPYYSYQMIKDINLLKEATKLSIYQHHERNDGSGYPMGIQQNKIHIYSKIISVADVFHAMTSERLYRSKQSPFKVLEMIRKESFGRFDHSIVDALTKIIITMVKGTKVMLSNGVIAEIVFTDPNNPTRPLVKNIRTEEMINLALNHSIYIEDLLD